MSGKRHYNLNKISQVISYSIDDIARLYNIHAQTALKWIRNGLKRIDNKKPLLIHGSELKRFLGELNFKNKIPTNFEEIFCFFCKQPHRPYRNKLFLYQNENNILEGLAVCPKHKKIITKKFKMQDIPRIKKFYDLVDKSDIYDSLEPAYKTQILYKDSNIKNESLKLFDIGGCNE